MKPVKTVSVFCVAIMLMLPCTVKATPVGSVDMAHSGFGAKGVMKIWGGGHNGLNVYAGVYMYNKTAGTDQGNLWPDGRLGLFCIELTEYATSHTTTYDVVKPSEAQCPPTFLGGSIGEEKAEYLRELWGRFFDGAWVDGAPFSSRQKSDAEAFTAAVWEILYEDLPASPSLWDVTADGTAGNHGFRCENADTATANTWLHALDGTGPKADLLALVKCGKQDYIVEVPEPATVALLGFGTLVFLLRRRQAYPSRASIAKEKSGVPNRTS